jgi:hypothetical protein
MRDPVIKKAAALFDKSGMTLDELGQKMGFAEGVARRAAWQFLNRVDDPRISTLRKFAKAIGVNTKDLFS